MVLKNSDLLFQGKEINNMNHFMLKEVDIVAPGGVCCASDLTVKIEQGSPLIVTGPNASGKSSLFRTLGGLWPIPTGKIEKKDALLFGVALSFISVFGLYYFSNLISASLLLLTIVFYVFVYTVWLKRKTPQNIVIGGASGALPPVIGWTIATNSLTFEPITLFLIIFYWTPSHFWALSLYKAKDYEKAKIPMLPNTNGVEETKKKIFIYSLFMLPVIILPYYIGFSGKLFLIASLVLTIYYNYICYDLLKFKKNKFEVKKAKKVFSYSIFYLFLIFVLFLIDKLI